MKKKRKIQKKIKAVRHRRVARAGQYRQVTDDVP